MFWTRFIELCNEAGKSPNAVAAACGVKSSGTVTGWSKGSIPRAPVLHRMAEYFHVSEDYLLGNVNDPCFYLDTERTLREINSYGDEDEKAPAPEGRREVQKEDLMAAFWGGDKDLSREDMDAMWQDVENFAAFVAEKKKREKQG